MDQRINEYTKRKTVKEREYYYYYLLATRIGIKNNIISLSQ